MIKLLEELPKRGPQAFDRFFKILVDTDQLQAAQLLKPGDVRLAMAMDTNNREASNEMVRIPDQNDTTVFSQPSNLPNIQRGII